MESARSLDQQQTGSALAALPGPSLVRRAGLGALRGLRELAASQSFVLAFGGFAMLLAGATMNSSTAAFFTNAQTVTTNNFQSGTVSLGAPTITTFSVTKMVPGDIFNRTRR